MNLNCKVNFKCNKCSVEFLKYVWKYFEFYEGYNKAFDVLFGTVLQTSAEILL